MFAMYVKFRERLDYHFHTYTPVMAYDEHGRIVIAYRKINIIQAYFGRF